MNDRYSSPTHLPHPKVKVPVYITDMLCIDICKALV